MSTKYKYIKPITMVSGHNGPHLLIIAGIHGDEYEPILAVERLLDEFAESLVLQLGKLTMVAVVNEPAHQLDARCGPDGKDLARTCPGNIEGTITEKIAAEISDLIRTADYLIDMHTGGKMYEIYPLSGYVLHSDTAILEKQRKMSQAFGLPIQWGTSPHLQGRTLSVARDAGVPAIYTEYGGGGPAQAPIIAALFRGCINVMVDLQMIRYPKDSPAPPRYIVEDHRPESGHLQILYPAPATGRIEYSVSLGDKVRKHQLLARMIPHHGKETVDLLSGEEGMIFLINRQAEVAETISTVGVLPINQPGNITIS